MHLMRMWCQYLCLCLTHDMQKREALRKGYLEGIDASQRVNGQHIDRHFVVPLRQLDGTRLQHTLQGPERPPQQAERRLPQRKPLLPTTTRRHCRETDTKTRGRSGREAKKPTRREKRNRQVAICRESARAITKNL